KAPLLKVWRTSSWSAERDRRFRIWSTSGGVSASLSKMTTYSSPVAWVLTVPWSMNPSARELVWGRGLAATAVARAVARIAELNFILIVRGRGPNRVNGQRGSLKRGWGVQRECVTDTEHGVLVSGSIRSVGITFDGTVVAAVDSLREGQDSS